MWVQKGLELQTQLGDLKRARVLQSAKHLIYASGERFVGIKYCKILKELAR